MAFQRADPTPFVLEGLDWEDVQNRQLMVHVVAGSRPPARNEDWAIANIISLPGNVLHFPVVSEILRDFVEDEMGLEV